MSKPKNSHNVHHKTFDLSQAIHSLILASSLVISPTIKAEDVSNKTTKHHYQISSGPLSHALSTFAGSSGILLSADAKLTDGKTSRGLEGEYTVEEGFTRLLAGTGLTHYFNGDNTVMLQATENQSSSDVETLPIVKVTGKVEHDQNDPHNKDYAISNASTGTKTDASIFDTPVTVQVVSKAVINDQQAIGLGDTLQNVSGVSKGWGFGANNNENIQIRGFNNDAIYRDGVLTPNSNNISLANVQRVEVLKGPAGMLFGRTQPGGLVNVITKRPQKESYYSLQQQFGSYDTYRTLLDATGTINKEGSLMYRLNYEHLDSNSFRDYVTDNRDFISPSLTWLISKDTSLDLDFMYQNRNTLSDSGIPYDLQLSGAIPKKIPINSFRNEPTDYNNSRFYEGDVAFTHRFNEDWKVRAKFSTIRTDGESAQTPSNGNANLVGDLRRGFLKGASNFESEYGVIDLTGHFKTLGFDHTVVIGTDYYQSNNSYSSSPYRTSVPTINIFKPVYGFTSFLNDPLGPASETKNNWNGAYIQDQVSLWDQWQLLFGSRFDHAEFSTSGLQKQVDEFSPRAGLMYHPLSWLGIYADYVNTFNAVNEGTTVSGGIPDPEKSREYEVGLKGEWLNSRLSANLAFFNLTKNNVQTPLPAPFVNKVAVTGEQRSRGIELDLRGQITDDWNLIATYAYTDALVTKDSAPLDSVIGSSGPGNAGNRLANVPKNSGSVWTTYDFSKFGAKGFSAGTGVFLASDRPGNINDSFSMPGYARLDTLLKYQHKVGLSNVTLQFNIQNLLDKEYITSSNGFASFIHQATPGAPRTFLGSVQVEF